MPEMKNLIIFPYWKTSRIPVASRIHNNVASFFFESKIVWEKFNVIKWPKRSGALIRGYENMIWITLKIQLGSQVTGPSLLYRVNSMLPLEGPIILTVHPRKPTYQWTNYHLKMYFLIKMVIFHNYASLLEGITFFPDFQGSCKMSFFIIQACPAGW